MPATDDNKRRGIETRLLIEGPMRLLAYPENSLQILEEGERLSKELRDNRSLVSFYGSMGLCYTFKGDPLQGIRYTEKSFGEAERIEDIDLAASTAFDLCSSYAIAGEHSRIVEVAPRVLALMEKTGKESEVFGGPFNFNLYSALLGYYGTATGTLGAFGDGEALCDKALRFAHSIDSLYTKAFAEMMYGWLFTTKGDGKNAVEHLESAVRHAEEGQVIPLLGLARVQLAYGHYFLGQFQTALKHIEDAFDIQRDLGFTMFASMYYHCLGMIHCDSGELSNAQSCAEIALGLSQDSSERTNEGLSRILLGTILGKKEVSLSTRAEEQILQGIRIFDELRMRPWLSNGSFFLGGLYADTGQKDKALETLKKAEAEFKDMGMDYWLHRTQEVLARVEC